jgi:hypothetical protein
MSWSVSASGTPSEVKSMLADQFKPVLADTPAGLPDEGERETVRRISETINQVLDTFDPGGRVTVSAHGHMSGRSAGAGAYQQVNLTISPSS